MSSLFVEMGISITFLASWLQTVILPISTSRVAEIIDLSHCAQPVYFYNNYNNNNLANYLKQKISGVLVNRYLLNESVYPANGLLCSTEKGK
jgi:hypothetical protein